MKFKVSLGGDPNSYITMVLFDTWADMENFTASYLKAAAEAKLGPEPEGVVAHSEWKVFRFAPGLSIMPAQASTDSRWGGRKVGESGSESSRDWFADSDP